jgi:hypothetical protein
MLGVAQRGTPVTVRSVHRGAMPCRGGGKPLAMPDFQLCLAHLSVHREGEVLVKSSWMLKKPLSWFKGREERKETGLEALLACGTTLKEVGPGVGAWAQDCCLVGLVFFCGGAVGGISHFDSSGVLFHSLSFIRHDRVSPGFMSLHSSGPHRTSSIVSGPQV